MTTPPVAPQPPLGRLAHRIVLGGFLLSLAAATALVLEDSDAVFAALIAVAGFGLLLAALPAVLLLFFSWRQPALEVPRETRRAAYGSAGALALIGGLYAYASFADGGAAGITLGVGVAALGVVAIVRARRSAAGTGSGSGARLAYGRSSGIGLFFFIVIAVILPKFACGCGTKGKAYQAQVKSDLRSLVLAEESYFADHHRYGGRADLDSLSFVPYYGDSIAIEVADDAGYRATGTHMNLPGVTCGVWVGARPPDGMHGAAAGSPVCWRD
jgi:hypothetical protein